MTIRSAMFLFLFSFTCITGWLATRAPADLEMVRPPQTSTERKSERKPSPQETPTTEPEEAIALSDDERSIQRKLNNIVIPLVDFQNTTVDEAVDFLRLRAWELDPHPDDSRKGISFTIRKTALDQGVDHELGLETAIRTQTITLQMENRPLREILDSICEQSAYRWQLIEDGVLLFR